MSVLYKTQIKNQGQKKKFCKKQCEIIHNLHTRRTDNLTLRAGGWVIVLKDEPRKGSTYTYKLEINTLIPY